MVAASGRVFEDILIPAIKKYHQTFIPGFPPMSPALRDNLARRLNAFSLVLLI